MSLTDTIPTSVITKANLHTFSVDEKNRREVAIKNKDFFYGSQAKYIKPLNNDVDIVYVNLTQPIINKKVSLLYSRPLKREYDGPAVSISFLEKTYDELNIDNWLKNADLQAELTGTSIFHIGKDEAGNITLLLFDGSEFSVISEGMNKRKIDALSIVSIMQELKGTAKNPQIQQSLANQVWTDGYITTFTNGAKTQQEPNELGYIPFVSFRGNEVNSQYLGHAPANDIRALNEIIDNQLTNLGYMIKMQSASPIVVAGFENGVGITIHPGRAIALPAGATAQALQLNPKIEETLAEIKYLEEKLYETTSIPKVSVVGDADSNSGKELLIKWYPLIQTFREKALRYQKYELDLANMILKVANMEPIKNVIVDWAEESILPLNSDTEDMEDLFKWGIATPADMIQRRDPTLTDIEAEAEAMANVVYNKQINPRLEDVTKE